MYTHTCTYINTYIYIHTQTHVCVSTVKWVIAWLDKSLHKGAIDSVFKLVQPKRYKNEIEHKEREGKGKKKKKKTQTRG